MMCGLPTYLHVALNNRPNSLASSYGSISTLWMILTSVTWHGFFSIFAKFLAKNEEKRCYGMSRR